MVGGPRAVTFLLSAAATGWGMGFGNGRASRGSFPAGVSFQVYSQLAQSMQAVSKVLLRALDRKYEANYHGNSFWR